MVLGEEPFRVGLGIPKSRLGLRAPADLVKIEMTFEPGPIGILTIRGFGAGGARPFVFLNLASSQISTRVRLNGWPSKEILFLRVKGARHGIRSREGKPAGAK